MIWLCENCKMPMRGSDTEDGKCPTCGLSMIRVNLKKPVEFDLILASWLYGKKQ